MIKQQTFAEQILQFNNQLSHEEINLPVGFKIINPYCGESKEQIIKITTSFYQKYFNRYVYF